MGTLRSLLVGAAVGLGLVLAALTPASAAGSSVDVAPAAANAASVSGEPWSSPAYPVDCSRVDSQVTCTPQNTADVKPQQCFINVLVGGAKATVCTTDESHISAIKTSGGKPLLVEYGCSLGDVVCVTFENAGRGLALSATSMMFAVAQNMRFDTSSLLWTAATDEWSFWQWAILAVLFGAMVWALAAAIVSGDRAELVGALVRSFIAVPATAITLWATGHLLNAVDDLTWYVLNRDGAGGLFATLQSVMWAGGQANYFFAFVIHGLLMLGMLLLMLVFAFRNIVLAALIAVAPIAWMLYPARAVGPQWVVRYVSAVVVLLLTGPLTVGFVTLIINGLAGIKTIWDPQSWPLLIGLALVAFAPFAVFGLFSFVGAVAADAVGSSVGSHAGRAASGAARAASRIPSRITASPAGAASRAPRPGSSSATASSAKGGASRRPAGPARSAATPSRAPSSPAPAPAGSSSSPPPSSQPPSSSSPATSPRDARGAQPSAGGPPRSRTERTA
ncbi:MULTISPECIES: hypothetical protein [Microbacterium]|uniref:Type IV secretion system protein n=1 Tax=Microbacterium wangchenii TaxID=2541726 RepID=A0ABX5SY47_9MICO|nr:MULTISPECIES: hypothetical protein [Microbacterium]MCK6065750.1 hypothetical protein [Microbacterium sp. EYE_512]QBR90067.1 hypothetical protein E4K62_16090 [Microbacterium wangchenii]